MKELKKKILYTLCCLKGSWMLIWMSLTCCIFGIGIVLTYVALGKLEARRYLKILCRNGTEWFNAPR